MLNEARRQLRRGRDVVAALGGTCGPEQAARAFDGIERIPPKQVEVNNATWCELDVEAVLRRAPAAVLIDQLAHTDTTGSGHTERWQDVGELLDAGIDVISTVGLQQLEGLEQAATRLGHQRKTVPEVVVRYADEVELVGMTPDALRELTVRWLTTEVDSAAEFAAAAEFRADLPISEPVRQSRVVAGVTGGPESETIIRKAYRIAADADADLAVVHVVRSVRPAAGAAERLARLRELTAALGTTLHTVTSDDVAQTLLAFAREANAGQLVIGRSRRARWARILDEDVGSTVVSLSDAIDIHVVAHEHARRGSRRTASRSRRRMGAWLAAFLIPAVVFTLAVTLLNDALGLGGVSALFVVGVVAVALLGRIVPAACAALLSGVLMSWFVAPPRYNLAVAELNDMITASVLLIVGVAVAGLVDVATKRTRQARKAARQAELLTMFSGAILHGTDLPGLLRQIREVFAQRAVSLTAGDQVLATIGVDPPYAPSEASTVIEAGDASHWLLLAGPALAATDRPVLSAVANQAVALVRQTRLAEEANAAAALQEADRLRRALLSAVSHDLRTPLAGAKAAVSSLRSDDIEFSPNDTAQLLETIEQSVDQLTALVGNLLDSSRLAVGVVTPRVRRVYLDETVHRALVSIGMGTRHAAMARVRVEVGDVAVLADDGLLERVLANLIDNALRHTPHPTTVHVTADYAGDRVFIAVVDSGPGVPQGAEHQLFEPFQRLGDSTSGVGLGLSVARGFVEAMGGTVRAQPTPGGGLTMLVDLPADDDRAESEGADVHDTTSAEE